MCDPRVAVLPEQGKQKWKGAAWRPEAALTSSVWTSGNISQKGKYKGLKDEKCPLGWGFRQREIRENNSGRGGQT